MTIAEEIKSVRMDVYLVSIDETDGIAYVDVEQMAYVLHTDIKWIALFRDKPTARIYANWLNGLDYENHS